MLFVYYSAIIAGLFEIYVPIFGQFGPQPYENKGFKIFAAIRVYTYYIIYILYIYIFRINNLQNSPRFVHSCNFYTVPYVVDSIGFNPY